jgi:hypothetical protein
MSFEMTSGAGASVLRGACMKERILTIPELILIAGTRVALGVGIGLLIADKLTDNERRAAGWALVGVGALTTVPLAMNVLGKSAVAERGLTDARKLI